MSKPRRVVQDVVFRVRVTTADTRDDAPERILTEVKRHLELAFGNAVTVQEIGVNSAGIE